MQNDLSEKTGEGIYRRASLPLDEITFNATEGVFYERDTGAKKDDAGKYPKTKITKEGQPLQVVFIKIRRIIASFSKKASMRTNEHNHKYETVTLYKGDERETGVARELREKYPLLRTQQIVYCYMVGKDKVARVVIKGASLGSDYKHPKDVLKFYDYLQSFEKDQHSYQFITQLVPVKEEGPQGDYYALSFVRGELLDEEKLVKILTLIDEVHTRTKEMDDRMASTIGKSEVEELPTIDIDDDFEQSLKDEVDALDRKKDYAQEEDITVADIPF